MYIYICIYIYIYVYVYIYKPYINHNSTHLPREITGKKVPGGHRSPAHASDAQVRSADGVGLGISGHISGRYMICIICIFILMYSLYSYIYTLVLYCTCFWMFLIHIIYIYRYTSTEYNGL